MFRLGVLGALQITDADGKPMERLAARSRRAALLAYLGAATPRGPHRRDKLLAIFWPESDDVRGRAALNQALYVLRGELGEDAIITRGDEVGLNSVIVGCDAAELDAAVVAGRPGDALQIYRGDLLEGFHVSEAPEFEHWLDRERVRLRQVVADAAWSHAEALAARGDVVEAGRFAKRSAALSPVDEAVVRRLMTFLRNQGDRAAAIHAYDACVATLRSDFELEPSAETLSLAKAIRAEQQEARAIDLPVPAWRGPGVTARLHGLTKTRRPYAAVAALSSLLMLAALGVWIARPNALAARAPRLAVLPFENLGNKELQYLVDGMTEEINGRLAKVSGLIVISRTSAIGLAQRTLRQIGEDLDVDYVLEGTVRGEMAASGGVTQIRLSPRLFRTSDEALVWSDRYTANAALGEVFRVQSDIAEQVAAALDITLRERERRQLADRPTESAYAYDYYLRGRSYSDAGLSRTANELAREMYERAIAADSTFALAWARLAHMHAAAYWFYYDRSEERLALAQRAAERAVRLRPDLPEAHLALGYYHYWGHLDFDKALAEFRTAQNLGLTEAELYNGIANVQRRQGRFDDAIANYESAVARNPRAHNQTFELAFTYAIVFDTVRAKHYFDHAIQLNPEPSRPYWQKARLYLGRVPDPASARLILQQPGAPARDSVIPFYLAWVDVLEGKQKQALERLDAMTAPALQFQFRFVPRAQLQATIHRRLGHRALARTYYDSARLVAERVLRERPDQATAHSALGLALAGLGRNDEALAHARRGVELMPLNTDAIGGMHRLEELARVYAIIGDTAAALRELDRLYALRGGRWLPIMELGGEWDLLLKGPPS